jgi:hypothetical protein
MVMSSIALKTWMDPNSGSIPGLARVRCCQGLRQPSLEQIDALVRWCEQQLASISSGSKSCNQVELREGQISEFDEGL